MTIDPQWIRTERHSAVGSLLLREAGIIVERWESRARLEQPHAGRVHHDVLRDHLAGLLQSVGRTLCESDIRNTFGHCESAVEHGQQRWQAGWSLSEVVRDYQILRLVVLEYLDDTLERPVTLHEVMALNLSLDEAISASVSSFVAERDEHLTSLERDFAQDRATAQQSLAKWERLFRHAGWGIAIVDAATGRLESANHAFALMHGLPVEQVLRQPLASFAVDGAAETFAARVQECRSGGHANFETMHRHADGSQFPVNVDLTMFSVEEHGAPQIAVNLQDISARKQLENFLQERADELIVADRRKDEFLATLAHELRNPLSPLWHAVESLRLADLDDATLRHTRDIMERQVKQLVRLVDDLLDVARIRQGKIDLRKRVVTLSDIVTASIEASRPKLEVAGHHLDVTLPPQPIELEADPARLEQVLCNLLGNAAKFTERKGEIRLTATAQDSHVSISVADTGIGIDPAVLPRIFNVFEQANPEVDRRYGGLGIGLSLVRSFVELHDGSVAAHSDGVGRGSTFTVRLPLLGSMPESNAPAEKDTAPATSKLALRLLVVDDNRDVADVLGSLLKRIGYQVSVAYDGPDALQKASSISLDVALLDIGLPDMDGYEVARRLIESCPQNRPTLVAMTGYGREEDRDRSREAGFDYHLVKPVSLASLQTVLQDIAGKKH